MNGSILLSNNEREKAYELHLNDQIQLGAVRFKFARMSDLERKTEEQKSERIPNSNAVLLCRVLKLDKLNVTQSTEFLCVTF